MSCGVGHRCSSDPALLWLYCRLTAVALILPLAWEPLYSTVAALKRQKKYNLRPRRVRRLAQGHIAYGWPAGEAGPTECEQESTPLLLKARWESMAPDPKAISVAMLPASSWTPTTSSSLPLNATPQRRHEVSPIYRLRHRKDQGTQPV